MGQGSDPTSACQTAIANIAKFYPKNYAALVAVDSNGKHGMSFCCDYFKGRKIEPFIEYLIVI